jgi:hypothetical protein
MEVVEEAAPPDCSGQIRIVTVPPPAGFVNGFPVSIHVPRAGDTNSATVAP